MSTGWPFIEYSAVYMGEPDGDAVRVWMPVSLSESDALKFGRREVDGVDGMVDREYVLRINGRGRWRKASDIECRIEGYPESTMVPAKRAGHDYFCIDVIPMALSGLPEVEPLPKSVTSPVAKTGINPIPEADLHPDAERSEADKPTPFIGGRWPVDPSKET